jgi:hypothetical protein
VVSAGPDDVVNCDKAYEVGFNIQLTWDDAKYADVSLKKNACIRNLASLHNTYKLEGDNSDMDTNSLFHRLVVLSQCLEDVATCFELELTPYPTSLFKDSFMRNFTERLNKRLDISYSAQIVRTRY